MVNFMYSRIFKMKFFCVLLLLCSCTKDTIQLCAASPDVAIDEKGHPTETLRRLLKFLAVEHDGTLKSVVEGTQKAWLRPAGTERWELVDTLTPEVVAKIKPLFDELMLTKEVPAQKGHYMYALLLGSRMANFIERLSYLIHVWNKGLRFDELVVLAGQRDLMSEETLDLIMQSDMLKFADNEKLKSKWGSVKTEKDMMQVIIEESVLPETMREKIAVTVVDAPKKLVNDKLVRPTTGDTVNAWLAKKPVPGTCVAISSQPHVLYQQAVLSTLLPKDFQVETIGRQGKVPVKTAEILDALARFLYQEQNRRQK